MFLFNLKYCNIISYTMFCSEYSKLSYIMLAHKIDYSHSHN